MSTYIPLLWILVNPNTVAFNSSHVVSRAQLNYTVSLMEWDTAAVYLRRHGHECGQWICSWTKYQAFRTLLQLQLLYRSNWFALPKPISWRALAVVYGLSIPSKT